MIDIKRFSDDVIDAEYARIGHNLGWRFLTCPQKNLGQASVALVSLNPGGSLFEPPRWSVEKGSAYVIECWKGHEAGQERLQQQVQRMFEIMKIGPAEALSGYLVPFRSKSWNDLPHKKVSLDFGLRLWRNVFDVASAGIIIGFGKDVTGPALARSLNASLISKHSAGWGTQTIDVYKFKENKKLIVLPHLSRFSLFGRAISERAFRATLA